MERTQKEIILAYLDCDGGWVAGFSLVNRGTVWGWLGSSGSRRARELEEDGKILRELRGKYAYYKTKECDNSPEDGEVCTASN